MRQPKPLSKTNGVRLIPRLPFVIFEEEGVEPAKLVLGSFSVNNFIKGNNFVVPFSILGGKVASE